MQIEPTQAVVPVLIGPLQVLLAILPGVLVAVGAGLISLFKPRTVKHAVLLAWRLKVPLLLIAGVVAGGIWVGGELWPNDGPAARAETAGSDWVAQGGGLRRSGAAGGGAGPAGGGVNWAWKQDKEAFFSSPAVVGNRVYVASVKLGMTSRGGSGKIYCFDADTGAVVWTGGPDDYRPTFSSPVVAGDYIVCGEGLHFHEDARIVCLDRRTGETVWTYRTDSHVECSPVVADGKVFIGAGDDGYYCLALEGDGEGNAKVLWHLPGEKYPDAETSLIAHDGKVYAGLGLGESALCVLDAETGEELKRLPMPYPLFSPPTIDDGKLYVGMGTGDYVNKAEQLGEKPHGELRCIDLASLETDWSVDVGRTILGAPAVGEDGIYVGSRDGKLYCIGREGKIRWSWNAYSPIIASPALADGKAYVVATSGVLYAVDVQQREPVWQIQLGGGTQFFSSPAIARGHAYVGTQKNGFLCVGEPVETRQELLWAGPGGGPGNGGSLDGSPLPELGEMLWNYPADRMGSDTEAHVTAPPAAAGDKLLVPLARGENTGLACLPLGAGETPEPTWQGPSPNGVYHSPAVVGSDVWFVDGQRRDGTSSQPIRRHETLGQSHDGEPATGDRYLYRRSLDAGKLRGKWPVQDDASGIFTATRRAVYIAAEARSLTRISESERAAPPVTVSLQGRLAGPPAAIDGMVVAALAEPDALVALDEYTLAELWRAPLSSPAAGGPIIDGRSIYLPTEAGLEGRSILDGSRLADWSLDGGGVSGDVALDGDRLIYISTGGELIVKSTDGGKLLHRKAGAKAGTVPLVARGEVLFEADSQTLRRWAVGEGNDPVDWADVSWLGEPATRMILHGSRVYVGRAGWGVVCLGGTK